ncbi:hypothetical protein NIES4101_45310 [Calothrix sp. NIES-4101]|nr:hypothetical protein NIES4101_45310 [Calothrix sp. NIES-4101]
MHKRNVIQGFFISAALGLGFISTMPAANAMNLIPQKEGEIQTTNLGCVVNAASCIKSSELGFSVTSLSYKDSANTTYAPSRLFIDKGETANNWGSGIEFGKTDLGTNTTQDEYWLRAVAYDAAGKVREKGQLEVGRFKFDFGKIISEITLDLFDIEDAFKTGILELNGSPVSQLLAANGNNGSTSIVLKNVSSFVLQLGNTGPDSVFKITGDGVRLTGLMSSQSIPEPSTAIAFGLFATVGTLGLKKRQHA